MNGKLLKRIGLYHSGILILLFTITSIGTYYFWQGNLNSSQKVIDMLEVSSLLDSYVKKSPAQKIIYSIKRDNARKAIADIDLLAIEAKRVNIIYTDDSHDNFIKSLQLLKLDLNNVISFPEVKSILNVLRGKVADFESFVVINKWKTLSRMSKRLNTELDYHKAGNRIFFQQKSLKALTNKTIRSLNRMRKVTLASVLDKVDKNLIDTKINDLKVEAKMLKKYISLNTTVVKNANNILVPYQNWIKTVSPEIALMRIDFDGKSKEIVLYLLATLAIIFFLFFVGLLIQKVLLISVKKETEKIILDTIKNSFIPSTAKYEFQFTQKFLGQFEKYREYIHRRMSFGSIFQEALPFGSLLLDSNLNLIWANEEFYGQWNLESSKVKKEGINWDELQRSTNLGENDPIIEAIQNFVAGIYQIQLQKKGASESTPYEMYVSPVEYDKQKRVMVFFYPLTSLEDTISSQSKTLVGPVGRSLDALVANAFTKEFQTEIQQDFEIANISHIFEKFCTFSDSYEWMKKEYSDELEKIECEFFDLGRHVDSVKKHLELSSSLIKKSTGNFLDVKNSFVAMVSRRSSFEESFSYMFDDTKKILSFENELMKRNIKLENTLISVLKILANVKKVRPEIKGIKSKMEAMKTKMKNDRHATANGESIEKTLSVLSFLEMSISKMEIIVEDYKNLPAIDFAKAHTQNKNAIENDIYVIKDAIENAELSEEEVITPMKELYASLKEVDQNQSQMDKIIQVHDCPLPYSSNETIVAENNIQ